MLRKHESAGLRLAVTLIHLALWAQLGVATRTFLAKFFTLGCPSSGGASSWGPCLNGAWFKDLPANMLGSFIIGLFAASSSVGLAVDKSLVLLPAEHPWQHNFELQIGIRTGYCGSLTTFASWHLELITMAVAQNKWGEAVGGYLVGMCFALVAYCVGLHAALVIDRWLARDRDVLAELAEYRRKEVRYISGTGEGLGEGAAQRLMEEAEPDLPRLVPGQPSPRQARSGGLEAQQLESAASSLLMEAEPDLPRVLPSRLSPSAAAAAAAGAADVQPSAFLLAQQPDGLRHRHHPAQQPDNLQAAEQGGKEAKEQQKEANGAPPPGKRSEPLLTMASFRESMRGYRTDGLVLLVLAGLTTALAVGVALQHNHEWLRQIWMCCLLGPFGCTLRWWLSRWNYKLGGTWAWFPAGTFAANMLGTTIDFSLQCVLQRRGADIGYWGNLMVNAVITGFNGSLTTVSTFMTEVVKFADAIPENYRAYTYTALSLGGGIVIGLALYGWSVWAY